MNETDVKYIAGLFDADGSFSLRKNNGTSIAARLTIAASDAVSPNHEILHWLASVAGGRVNKQADTTDGHSVYVWAVQGRADLERLVPRLLKHLVVKGNSLNKQWQLYQEARGMRYTPEELDEILEQGKVARRAEQGPIKPKKHPTWAWVAGFLDGDGSYKNRYYPKSSSHHMRVYAVAHEKDRASLDLLQHAFGGHINAWDKKRPHLLRWERNLGFSDSSFALHFLRKVHRHAKIKKWRIEQIIHIHQQRLNEQRPTG